jgi:hypothetical protein
MVLAIDILLLQAILSYIFKIYQLNGLFKKFYKLELLINKVQCEHHNGLKQHQTDIQPPATHYGEFHNILLHSPHICHEQTVYLEKPSHTFC